MDMKKIIIASTVFLLVILLAIFILTIPKKQTKENVIISVTPTTVPAAITQIKKKAILMTPYENSDFGFTYQASTDQLIVVEKSSKAKAEFAKWANMNGLTELATNPNLIIYASSVKDAQKNASSINTSITPSVISPTTYQDFNPAVELINTLIQSGQGGLSNPISQVTIVPTEIPESNSSSNSNSSSKPNSNLSSNSNGSLSYTYYGQCGALGDIPLPDGCNLCKAGCGPTTVAMIASSYLGNNFNPKTIVDIYKKNGYYLGCGGSSYADAKSVFEQLGLKTTSYISFNTGDANEAAADFKKYLDGGWTIFTLANYCDAGCGHYFWVTKVSGGNILAYDPYYGQNSSPPFNENSKSPFPKYRIAFGVKK